MSRGIIRIVFVASFLLALSGLLLLLLHNLQRKLKLHDSDLSPISLACQIDSIKRINSGIVISGQLHIMNQTGNIIDLGEGDVIGMTTLCLRDHCRASNLEVNMANNRSLQNLIIERVTLMGAEHHCFEFVVEVRGITGNVGEMYTVHCKLKSSEGEEYVSNSVTHWMLR